MPRRYLGWIVLVALTGASGLVRAQARTGATNPAASQVAAERQRLRSELDRVNAEIDALKRDSRSLRDDYLLRNRMADAEALARRLTALDAGLPSAVARGSRNAPAAWQAPEASPSDDRAVLEAKADILADQARRLNSQADSLAGRVTELRARNELRRRAGQLERDPFSALEQAKRRLATTAATPSSPSSGAGFGTPMTTPPDRGDSAGAKTTTDSNTGSGSATTVAMPTGTQSATTGTSTSVGTNTGTSTTSTTSGGAATPSLGVTSTSSSGSKAQPSLVASTQAGDNAGSVALQFREILDASTLAEIRRLEIAGPGGSLSAMEHALAALRARAAQLSAKANLLRVNAKTAP